MAILIAACHPDKTLFTLLPASQTGVIFSNRITETDTMNIIDYEYIYNGGGVGIGDFNNDGLPDLYFTGNMVGNRLYLNKGGFKFADVTAKAGVAGAGRWCSGVSVVDINNDGRADLYIATNTKKNPSGRANLLYINQGWNGEGVPVFAEQAAQYGIADTTHTTQSAFFDYDNDGDLDLYLLVNEMDKERYPNRYHKKITDGTSARTDRLYRNDWNDSLQHPVFTNVSKQAGITTEGFGLGVTVADINRDGWKDIYVTNDYITNDLLWINNGNGTFTDRAAQYLKHTCHSAMGNDVADINNDGWADIIALDMLPEDNFRKKMFLNSNNYFVYQYNQEWGYQDQFVKNTLQLNQGYTDSGKNLIFSDISFLSGIAETDWSWCPLVADFDHDGYRDIIVTNGFPKDVTDHDFMAFQSSLSGVAGKSMMLQLIPSVKIKNYAFRNRGDLTFENTTDAWGIAQPSFSNGAAYADLDNDGDLDYAVNNINDSAFVYRNNLVEQQPSQANYLRLRFEGSEKNRMGLGAMVEITYGNGKRQVYEHFPTRGYLSTVEPTAHFGLSDAKAVEEIRVTWPGGHRQEIRNVKANQVLRIAFADAKPSSRAAEASLPLPVFADATGSSGLAYVHQENDFIDFNIQKLLPHKFSQYGPSLAVGDVNADGLDDIFLGGSAGYASRIFVQRPDGRFVPHQGIGDETIPKGRSDAGVLLFDADNDGDNDLYCAGGGYELVADSSRYRHRFYRNDGRGKFGIDTTALPTFYGVGSCVRTCDFDRDGDLDLFVGGRVVPGRYPLPPESRLLVNNGKGRFSDLTDKLAPGLRKIGMVTDALWTDFDNDGWTDLMLVGEWMPITFFKNGTGKTFNHSLIQSFTQSVGWWNSLAAADFDNDGDTDYLAGNLGLNTLNRASEQEPVRVYAKDFDNNGFFDAIPSAYFKDERGVKREFPFFSRDDMVRQMVGYRRFSDYKSFATAGMDSVLAPEQMRDAFVLRATYMQSAYVENLGKGNFKITALPMEAQFAPVFGMLTDDFDTNGNLDVLLVGNDFGCEVGQGKMDAFNGLLMLGNGKGGFRPQTVAQSGIFVPGNAKAVARIVNAWGGYLALATQNQDSLKVFAARQPRRCIRLRPTDSHALLTLANGRIRRTEFYYGDSFFSQSARVLVLDSAVKTIRIYDTNGKMRTVDVAPTVVSPISPVGSTK